MATNIPLPAAPSPELGSPLMAGFRRGNALDISNAEAQYAPYTNYANAISKIAFANTAPAQALATFMSGPAAQYLDRPTLNALAQQMQQYTQGINAGNALLPMPGKSNFFDNPLGTIVRSIIGNQGIPVNSLIQSPQITQPMQPNQGIVPSQPPSIVAPTQQTGAIPNIPQVLGRYGTQAASTSVPGTVGGMTPQAGSEATAAALKAGATGEVENENTRLNKMIEVDNQNAQGAINRINLIDKVRNARGRLLPWVQKGKIGGNIPALTPAADEYDAGMASLVAQMAIADSQGNLTNEGRSLAAQAKYPRSVTDTAFNHLVEYNSGMERRAVEKPAFNNAMRQAGADSTQIPLLWYHYQTNRPFYDNKTHKQDEDNINSWQSFYSDPTNIQAAFSPNVAKQLAAERKKALPVPGEKEKAKTTSRKTATSVKLGDTTYLYQNGVYYK